MACTLALPLSASEPDTFNDWAVECDTAPTFCILSQTSAADEDGLWLGTVRLRADAQDGADVVVLVPAGVHLASGLFIGVRQPLTQIRYQSCTKDACTAAGKIDKAELTRWRRGSTAQMRYRPSIGAPPVSFSVSLLGISAALRHAAEKES